MSLIYFHLPAVLGEATELRRRNNPIQNPAEQSIDPKVDSRPGTNQQVCYSSLWLCFIMISQILNASVLIFGPPMLHKRWELAPLKKYESRRLEILVT